MQSFFEGLDHTLLRPTERSFQDGSYVFKVSLTKVWRRIAIPARATLADLSNAILTAFGFDDDHLYEFTFQDVFGASRSYGHFYMDQIPRASKLEIGHLPFGPGGTMTYHYDFGDNWRFEVLLEEVREPSPEPSRRGIVVASRGEAPPQYR